MSKTVLAFDFGASSGRAMLGSIKDGKIVLEEIHRFSNDTVIVNGTMYWDTLRLWFEIKQAITKAILAGGFDAIGIDTWGVDFGLIDKNGALLSSPVHYRDRRTEGVPSQVFDIIPKEQLYYRTGIQFMRINTLYQLFYLNRERKYLLDNTDKLLLTPDLFSYFLTGEKKAEYTIASTTNMLDPTTRDWNYDLLRELDIPTDILPEIVQPGSVYGMLSEEICKELGCKSVPVIAVGTHDTASAVLSAPASGNFVYISCGTWSLFGTELDSPIISERSAEMNYTNEGGCGGKIRFLRNIMGLWLIQESRRQYKREGKDYSFAELEKAALGAPPFQCFIDCDAPEFENAGNLPLRVREFCEKTGQYVPQTDGEVMRCIYESLAMKYKNTFAGLTELTGKSYDSINMLGGGIKDTLLCSMTACATGVRVLAGPVEATATGNTAQQLIALGEIEDICAARRMIADSIDLKHYEPQNTADWDSAYERYLNILGK